MPTLPQDTICLNCVFWEPPDGDDWTLGQCRCLSPTGQTWGDWRFPPVAADDWCGKWELTTIFRTHFHIAGAGSLSANVTFGPHTSFAHQSASTMGAIGGLSVDAIVMSGGE